MNEIVQMVSQKFNLSPEVAQQVVEFIGAQVKSRLPEGVSQQFDSLMAGGSESSSGLMDKMKNMASSVMGKA